jgi:hypothetical protein
LPFANGSFTWACFNSKVYHWQPRRFQDRLIRSIQLPTSQLAAYFELAFHMDGNGVYQDPPTFFQLQLCRSRAHQGAYGRPSVRLKVCTFSSAMDSATNKGSPLHASYHCINPRYTHESGQKSLALQGVGREPQIGRGIVLSHAHETHSASARSFPAVFSEPAWPHLRPARIEHLLRCS